MNTAMGLSLIAMTIVMAMAVTVVTVLGHWRDIAVGLLISISVILWMIYG